MPDSNAPTPSRWTQAWQWATSAEVRAHARAERAFLDLLGSLPPEQEVAPEDLAAYGVRLDAALQGADPGMVNRPLPETFGPAGQPGLPPMLWALLNQRWALATRLLDHGADPAVLVQADAVAQHLDHLPSLPYHERLSRWPRALLSPLSVAVMLADRAWEAGHERAIYSAWVDNPWSPSRRDPLPTLDQHPRMGPLLTALMAREDLPWTLPDAASPDADVREDSAPVHLLVGQGSTLMGWPDAWLQRMNLGWSGRRGNLLSTAVRGCFACRHMDLDHLPAFQRLLGLGVDPQPHLPDGNWRRNPVTELVSAVNMGPLKPRALLTYAFDERLDWEGPGPNGLGAWERLRKMSTSMSEKSQAAVVEVLDELHARRVEREARELRRAMHQARVDAHLQRQQALANGTWTGEQDGSPVAPVSRSRSRL